MHPYEKQVMACQMGTCRMSTLASVRGDRVCSAAIGAFPQKFMIKNRHLPAQDTLTMGSSSRGGNHLGIKTRCQRCHQYSRQSFLNPILRVCWGIQPHIDTQRRIQSLHEMPPVFGHIQHVARFEDHRQWTSLGEAREPALHKQERGVRPGTRNP